MSLSNAILSDGTAMPASVGNTSGILISGFPSTDVKTSIETAGDLTQIQTTIGFIGTEFGVNSSGAAEALPKHINLTNAGYTCGDPKIYGRKYLYILILSFTYEVVFLSMNGDSLFEKKLIISCCDVDYFF